MAAKMFIFELIFYGCLFFHFESYSTRKVVEIKWSSFFDRIFFYPLKLNYKHFGGHFEFLLIPGLLIKLWKQSGLRFFIRCIEVP